MTGLLPKPPKIPAPKPVVKAEDVATPEKSLARRGKRRGVAANILSDKLGGSGKLGG